MADSTLDPYYLTGGPDRSLGRGHGTDSLGPSDLSDTGSDMQGVGLSGDVGLDMDEGTTSDAERSTAGGTAGPDVGDANLDSDTDSGGTGERAAAGRDSVEADGEELDTDQVQHIEAVDPDNTDVDAGR